MYKNKILDLFLKSNIKIKSKDALIRYLEFCISKNTNKSIKGKTSHHHILPSALFEEYSSLAKHSWNGYHLLYSDHYYAHWLLTEAIDDYGQLHAFTAMHNKDIKSGKIEEKDLIPAEEFQLKMEERGRKHSTWLKDNPERIIKRTKTFIEKRIIDGVYTSSAIIAAQKRADYQKSTFVDGLSLIQHRINKTVETKKINSVTNDRHLLTMKTLDENGKTLRENATAKMLDTQKNTLIVCSNGEEISIFDLRRINVIKARLNSYKKYKILFNNIVLAKGLLLSDIKDIHPPLVSSSFNRPLGYNTASKNKLKKLNITELAGCYIEIDDLLDHTPVTKEKFIELVKELKYNSNEN